MPKIDLKNTKWRDYGSNASNDIYNHSGGFMRGTDSEADIMWAYLQKHGVFPSASEMEGLSADFAARKDGSKKAAYKNVKTTLEKAITKMGGNPLDYNAGLGDSDSPATLMDDLVNIDKKGSAANRLFETLLKSAEDQYKVGTEQSQIAQRDLGVQQAMERQKYIDQIRNRRKTMLKSGLSSVQLANEEIQSLLISQSLSSDSASQFFQQRQGLEQNYQMRDTNARLGVYEMAAGGLGGNMAATGAAMAGSAYDQALLRGQGIQQQGSLFEKYIKDTVKTG